MGNNKKSLPIPTLDNTCLPVDMSVWPKVKNGLVQLGHKESLER